jgi:hypothetical protein
MHRSITLTQIRRGPTHRRALVQLAALAIALASVAVPLADSAHAGGKGGIGGDMSWGSSRPPLTKPN